MRYEPKVIINGVELNSIQAMVLRGAITSHEMEMNVKFALGKDKVGEDIRKGNLRLSREILDIIFNKQDNKQDNKQGNKPVDKLQG